MSWTAVRATTGSWATGRAVTRRRSQELLSVMRMARALVPLVGTSASDRDAFSPVRTAIEKRVAVGHRLYYQWLSPWLVPIALPPLLVVMGGNPRASALIVALVWTFGAALWLPSVRYRVLTARIAVALATGLTTFTWVMVFRAPKQWVSPWLFPQIGRAALVIVIVVELPLLIWRLIVHRRKVSQECHSYDALVVRIVWVAHRLHSERSMWRSSAACRRWAEAVETLAVDAARCLALTDRTDAADGQLRKELRVEADRIAEGIRLLKSDLVRARSEAEVTAVVESLVRGMLLVARGDRAALLATAPPPAAAPDLVSRVRARVVPAALWFAAAWLVPLIPPIARHPALAQTAMWSLIVSGATALATANPEVRSRIQEVVAKALPPA
ncbi:hypothetical protein [Kitasatospora sp. NPDC004272]